MSTLIIELDDASARLVHEAARAASQPVADWLRSRICEAITNRSNHSVPRRISPLHPGAMRTTHDFDAPIDEFTPYV